MAAIRANPSPLPDSNSATRILATYGRISPASFEKSSRGSVSSKMSEDIYDWDSNKSTMTFDQWVIALRRACLRRKKSVRRTSANGSSSWLTPRAQESGERRETFLKRMGDRTDRCSSSLMAQTALWPTPRAREPGSTSPDHGIGLNEASRMWSTPTARDWKDGMLIDNKTATRSNLSRQAPRTHLGGSASLNAPRTLNPLFVEMLMGWPIGWTDCGSAVTALCRWSRLMRFELLRLLHAAKSMESNPACLI